MTSKYDPNYCRGCGNRHFCLLTEEGPFQGNCIDWVADDVHFDTLLCGEWATKVANGSLRKGAGEC